MTNSAFVSAVKKAYLSYIRLKTSLHTHNTHLHACYVLGLALKSIRVAVSSTKQLWSSKTRDGGECSAKVWAYLWLANERGRDKRGEEKKMKKFSGLHNLACLLEKDKGVYTKE